MTLEGYFLLFLKILKEDNHGSVRIEIMIDGQRKAYQVDFCSMIKTCLDDNRTTSIVRSLKVSFSTEGKAFSLNLLYLIGKWW